MKFLELMDSLINQADHKNNFDLDDRCVKIKNQIEFYFSDQNLQRDGFFRKEMFKRTDGGILISLLLNCNLLRDMDVTEDCLRKVIAHSSLVSFSKDGKC